MAVVKPWRAVLIGRGDFLATPGGACRILIPPSGMEPVPPAVRAQSPNHWTAREFPRVSFPFLSRFGSGTPDIDNKTMLL